MHLCKKFFLSHICIYLNFNRTRAFLRICLHLEVLDSSTFLLLAELFLTESEVKWSCIHHQTFFFSAIQCCQWRKAKCFQSFVLACQSFLSCVQQTNENVFCAKSSNAFALQHLTSKTERVLGTTKGWRLLLYALYLAQPNKKLCFFLDCIPPSRIWPLPKPTTQNLDFTNLDWKVCRLHGRKYL